MANIISDETIEYVGILAKLELSDEEIAKRLAAFDRKCVTRDGYLGIYQTCVRPLMEGAVLRGRPEL